MRRVHLLGTSKGHRLSRPNIQRIAFRRSSWHGVVFVHPPISVHAKWVNASPHAALRTGTASAWLGSGVKDYQLRRASPTEKYHLRRDARCAKRVLGVHSFCIGCLPNTQIVAVTKQGQPELPGLLSPSPIPAPIQRIGGGEPSCCHLITAPPLR